MAQRTVAKKSARNDASHSNHSKSTSAPGFASETSSATCPCSVEATQRRSTRTPCCASRDQNCIRQIRSRNTWRKNLRHEAEHIHLAVRSTSREFSNQMHAARDLEVRSSNKHSVTPWNREAVFRNLGVVQDLLRKWRHQFRTAAWPRRILTTSLSQHHSNKTCFHEWRKNAHTPRHKSKCLW